MPRAKKESKPKVEELKVVKSDKPEKQKGTGKFEKLLHDGKYYLVNVDGRILSSGDNEDTVDRMVMNLNNKRR